jgi:uncharacterized membrane protein
MMAGGAAKGAGAGALHGGANYMGVEENFFYRLRVSCMECVTESCEACIS